MITLALGIVGVLVGVGLLARHDERAVREEWGRVLSPTGLEAIASLEAHLRSERRAFNEAQLLDAGAWYLAQLVPERVRLLTLVARYARMVSALRARPRVPLTAIAQTLIRLTRPSGSTAAAGLEAIDGEILASCRALVEDLSRS